MRLVLEHPDGRRMACEEEEFADPAAHPLNRPHRDVMSNPLPDGSDEAYDHDGRPEHERVSLADEGWVPVAEQYDGSKERPLPKGYKAPRGGK